MSLTPEFLEMLRGGIGTRTQTQFAKETGLTNFRAGKPTVLTVG